MRRDRVAPRSRRPLTLTEQLWRQLFPPSYNDLPWPIPYETGRRWTTARYLRREGLLSAERRLHNTLLDLRDLVVAVVLCALFVGVADLLVHIIGWMVS